jgi:hypothetical protein
VDTVGVGYRNSPSFDDRFDQHACYKDSIVKAVGRPDANWLKVELESHGTKYLPISKGGKVLFERSPESDAAFSACSYWKCVDPQGVAYRNSPYFDDRFGDVRGPEKDTIVQAVERVGPDANWLKVELESHGTKYLPISKQGGEVLFQISAAPISAQEQHVSKVACSSNQGNKSVLGISQTMQVVASIADAAGVQLVVTYSDSSRLTEHSFLSFQAHFVQLFGSIASDIGIEDVLIGRVILVGCLKYAFLFQEQFFFADHSSFMFLRERLKSICLGKNLNAFLYLECPHDIGQNSEFSNLEPAFHAFFEHAVVTYSAPNALFVLSVLKFLCSICFVAPDFILSATRSSGGCSKTCKTSHFSSDSNPQAICNLCGLSWLHHKDHTCQMGPTFGQRGRWGAGSSTQMILKQWRGPSSTVDFSSYAASSVVSFNEFSTVRGQAFHRNQVFGFFEIEVIESGPCPQFGFCSRSFSSIDGESGDGVGDDAQSWGWDGQRHVRWMNGQQPLSKISWNTGDVLGFLCDFKSLSMSFFRNGCEIDTINFERSIDVLYAALTGRGTIIKIMNVGDYKFPPPLVTESIVSAKPTDVDLASIRSNLSCAIQSFLIKYYSTNGKSLHSQVIAFVVSMIKLRSENVSTFQCTLPENSLSMCLLVEELCKEFIFSNLNDCIDCIDISSVSPEVSSVFSDIIFENSYNSKLKSYLTSQVIIKLQSQTQQRLHPGIVSAISRSLSCLRVQLQSDHEYMNHCILCSIMQEVFCSITSSILSERGPCTVSEFGSMIEATKKATTQTCAFFSNDPCVTEIIRSCETRFLFGQFVSRKCQATHASTMLGMLQRHISLYRYTTSTLLPSGFTDANILSILPIIMNSFLEMQSESLSNGAICFIELFQSYAQKLGLINSDDITRTFNGRLCSDSCNVNHEGHGLCRVCKQPWCMHVQHLCQSHLHKGKRGQWLSTSRSGVRASQGASEQGFEPSEIDASASLIERVLASSNQEHAGRLLFSDLDQFWESSGEQGTHWICLQLKADVVADQVGIVVDTDDDSYCPKVLTVRVASSAEGLDSATQIELPSFGSSGGKRFLPVLSANEDAHARFIKIGVKDCGGINCKIRGVIARVSKKGKCSNTEVDRSEADRDPSTLLFECVKAAIDQSVEAVASRTKLELALSWLRTLETSDMFGSPPAPEVIGLCSFESPHPYPDNSDVVHKISVPGASRLEIVFDPQCKTEKNCDYVRFVLPDGRVVGDDKYTGRSDSAHWAGVGSTPALVIEGSEVEARFHSDGSDNDWGYKFTAEGYGTVLSSRSSMYRHCEATCCFDLSLNGSCNDNSEMDRVPSKLHTGDRVQRGPHWIWDDQDGGIGGIGTVTEVQSNGWVEVQWDSSLVHSQSSGKDCTEVLPYASNYKYHQTFPEILVLLRVPLYKLMMAELLKPESHQQICLFLENNVTHGHKLFEILFECLGDDSFRTFLFDPIVAIFQSSYLRFELPFIINFFDNCTRSTQSAVSSFIQNLTFEIANKFISASASNDQETVESTIRIAIANAKSFQSAFTHLGSQSLLRSIFDLNANRCVIASVRRVDPDCVFFASLFFNQTAYVRDFLLICLQDYRTHEDFQKFFEDIAQNQCSVENFTFCIRSMMSIGSGQNHNLQQLYSIFSRIFSQKLNFLPHSLHDTVSIGARLCSDSCNVNHEGHGLCRVCKQPWCMHVQHLCQSHLHKGKRGQWLSTSRSGVRASQGASEQGFEPSEIDASASLIERVLASSNQEHAGRLLSSDLDQFWESSGEQGTHWICLQLKADVVADQVGIVVDTDDDSYCPKVLTVRVASSAEGLDSATQIELPSFGSSGGKRFLPVLSANEDAHARFIKIGVKDCGGINCKIRGVIARVSKKGKCSNTEVDRSEADRDPSTLLFECVKAAIDQSVEAVASRTKLELALSWLRTLETSDMFGSPPAPEVIGLCSFESPHPYPDNSDVVHKISVPGASRLEIVFDPQCKTEKKHDYVRFVLPDGRVVGDDKYTGRSDSAHWAGVGSTPALVIEGSEVEARFHSDGSEHDWGYKFTAEGYGTVVSSNFFCDALELFRVPLHQYVLAELFAMAASSDVNTSFLLPDGSYFPLIGDILAERLFDDGFRHALSSQFEKLFSNNRLIDIILYSLNFTLKLSSNSSSQSLPSQPVAPVVLESFVVGSKVRLSPDFASFSDASGGPLKLGDIGAVVKCSPPRYQVEFQSQEWWYDPEALALVHETSESSISGILSNKRSMASKSTIVEWSVSLFTTMFSTFLATSHKCRESSFSLLACKMDVDSQMHHVLQCALSELKEHIQFSYDCALLSFCVQHGCFSVVSLYNMIGDWFKEQPRFTEVCYFAQELISKLIQTNSIQNLLLEFVAMLFTFMNSLSKHNLSRFDSEWEQCQRLSVISTLFQDQMSFFYESSVCSEPFGTTSIFCEHPVFVKGALFPVHAELSISRFSIYQDTAKLKIIKWFSVDEFFNMSSEGGSDIIVRCRNMEGNLHEFAFCPQFEHLNHWVESFQKLQASRKLLKHENHTTWSILKSTFDNLSEPCSANVLFDVCCLYMSSFVVAGASTSEIRRIIRSACKHVSNDDGFLIQTMFNWLQILESKRLTTISNILVDLGGKTIPCTEDFIFSDTKQETLRVCPTGLSSAPSKVSKLFYEIEIVELSSNSSLSCGWCSEHADGSLLMWYADGIRQRSTFPLFNRAGCLMKPGKDSSVLYCSKRFRSGSTIEQCGPNRGPQCQDCKAHNAPKKYELLKWNQGDIVGIAADLETKKLYVSINGLAFDESALFCDGINAPDSNMHLVPSIAGKSAKIRINLGTSPFRFLPVEFTPYCWHSGSHALLQILTKLCSDIFLEELTKMFILDWTPSSSLCEMILRIICIYPNDAYLIKHIRRSLLLDVDRWENEDSTVSCGTYLFRAMLESDNNLHHLMFHIFRKTSFKLLRNQFLSGDMCGSSIEFRRFFGVIESCISSLKSIVRAPRSEIQSEMIANATFCLINSLNLDPAQVELRSGNFCNFF